MRGRQSAESRNFYPRSRKGATSPHLPQHYIYPHFYPRSRKGSDFLRSRQVHNCNDISIHAPARGATQANGAAVAAKIFLSTLPQGERPGPGPGPPGSRRNFYPRSRKGSDKTSFTLPPLAVYFYPRSRKGSDDTGSSLLFDNLHFYPRSRKGSDKQGLSDLLPKKLISIHAPARGATHCLTSL